MQPITIIDQTIREGMQFQGMVFSLAQRRRILEFQEALGVDICQAGYPSAHLREAAMVKALADHATENKFRIRVAALGRAFIPDAKILVETGICDIHFHLHLKPGISPQAIENAFSDLSGVIGFVRTKQPCAVISLAMLDMGKTPPALLDTCIRFLCTGKMVDIISLPDTSGIMAPNQVADRIQAAAALAGKTPISIHCHNDLGMAAANCVMGIVAGAKVLEVSALGIGERNGIGDLYLTARLLADQGIEFRLDLDNLDLIHAYYAFVDRIVREQTGQGLISATTPVFGKAVHTHVAGTHADGAFGTSSTPDFHLNLLCGRHLVKKYLCLHNIGFNPDRLDAVTAAIKDLSVQKGRRLEKHEIQDIARRFS
jgi:isopropylmalate/homocitrate/citramalate synthase